jgi:2-haloacid dehalogenase
MSSPTLTPPIEAVVFDLGGVLLDWNPRYLYRQLFDDDVAMEHFLSEICTMAWHDAHDRGKPFAVGCAELAAVHPQYAEMIMAWGDRSEEMVRGPIDATVEILRELVAGGVRCYALTNMETETYPLRVERFPFMSWFDGSVVSGFEGVSKPDPEIFRRLLERFGLTAASTAFVDDAARNVRAASKLGIQTVQYESARALRRTLEQAGLLAAD